MSPRLLRLALGVATGLLAALLYLGVQGTGPPSARAPASSDAFFAEPLPAPPLRLQHPDGTWGTLDGYRGRVAAVFFGYTNCPDVCPITLAQLARLQGELDPEGDDLQIVFVSLDPARDTPDVLQRFAARLHPDLVALTAPVDTLRPQVLEYGIGFVYRPRDGGPVDSVVSPPGAETAASRLGDDYLVDHTARTFLIDREGRLVAQILPEGNADALRDALRRALDGR
jgi:protein SCO1/2